jgi:hypothetical protein
MRKLKILILISLCLLFFVKGFSANRVVGGQKFFQRNYLNSADTIINYINEQDYAKGQILLHLSFPYVNSFHITPLNENSKTNSGFMGYSIGLGYCYKKNQYVNITISKIMDSNTPIIFVPIMKEFELLGSDYLISLSNNHRVNRFSLGYGLSFAQNYWEIVNNSWKENGTGRKPMRKSHNVLGFNFSSFFRISDVFQMGIIYRPTFFRLNIGPKFKYEHSISIDFALKIPLRKNITAANN